MRAGGAGAASAGRGSRTHWCPFEHPLPGALTHPETQASTAVNTANALEWVIFFAFDPVHGE